MKNSETGILSLFEGGCEGEETMSDHTPRTQSTGDMSVASVAGEPSNTLREEEFRALMEGEYKDLFTAYFQETFNRRFKEHKELKAELEHTRAVVQAAARYFDTDDRDKLLAALRVDKNEKTQPQKEGESLPLCDNGAAATAADLSRYRAPRPTENALGIGFDRVPGAGKMTREERAELARRAARGEHVTL